jgi:hypothetical protein
MKMSKNNGKKQNTKTLYECKDENFRKPTKSPENLPGRKKMMMVRRRRRS